MAGVGKPDIPVPRDLSLRSLQLTVASIRERLSGIDAAIRAGAKGGDSVVTAGAGSLVALASSVRSLAARVAALEGALGVGDVLSMTAAEPIAQFAPVVPLSATDCGEADPNDPTRRFGVLGLALVGAGAGQPISIQRRGPISIPGAVFEAGRAVYAFAGGVTQSPAYASAAIVIGVAMSDQDLWISPAAPVLQYPGLYDDAHDAPMPAAWGLVRSQA